MVGVPGRSKGCNTCRLRKVGCDLTRPSCTRCIKSGRTCGGYQRPATFYNSHGPKSAPRLPTKFHWSEVPIVFADPLTPSSVAKLYSERDEDDTGSSDDDTVLSSHDGECIRMLQQRGQTIKELHDVKLTGLAMQINPAQMHKHGFIAQVWSAYHLPDHQAMPNWLLPLVATTLGSSVSVDTSLICVTLALHARLNSSRQLLLESSRLYSHALRHLSKALAMPSTKLTNGTLLAAMALKIYESVGGGDDDDGGGVAWKFHSEGLAGLVRARGPKGFCSGDAHEMWCVFRMEYTLHAMIRREAVFLEQEEWMTEPWRDQPKSQVQRLLDCIVRFPRLLEMADGICGEFDGEFEGGSLHARFLTETWALIQDMQSWMHQFEREGPRYTLTGVTFPQVFTPRSKEDALTYAMLWTCQLIIHGTYTALRQKWPYPNSHTDPQVPTPPTQLRLLPVARQICSLHMHLHQRSTPLYSLLPLAVAQEVFAQCGVPEAAWIARVFIELSQRGVAVEKDHRGRVDIKVDMGRPEWWRDVGAMWHGTGMVRVAACVLGHIREAAQRAARGSGAEWGVWDRMGGGGSVEWIGRTVQQIIKTEPPSPPSAAPIFVGYRGGFTDDPMDNWYGHEGPNEFFPCGMQIEGIWIKAGRSKKAAKRKVEEGAWVKNGKREFEYNNIDAGGLAGAMMDGVKWTAGMTGIVPGMGTGMRGPLHGGGMGEWGKMREEIKL